ncbi:hypothetical protein E2C01_088516 [Portunus trituberculatus]|uniref:Uncharacterized protein n=1 Tax=Portunus trituberculatus TaxID=210409 RepID=A0A5B7J9H1_PORTR|nr:hypothetical protein [Portunus trituberculatus]
MNFYYRRKWMKTHRSGGFHTDGCEPLSARDEDGSVTCTVMRTGAALNYFRFSRDCAVKGHAGTWGAARLWERAREGEPRLTVRLLGGGEEKQARLVKGRCVVCLINGLECVG